MDVFNTARLRDFGPTEDPMTSPPEKSYFREAKERGAGWYAVNGKIYRTADGLLSGVQPERWQDAEKVIEKLEQKLKQLPRRRLVT